jgi:hypothetical protein
MKKLISTLSVATFALMFALPSLAASSSYSSEDVPVYGLIIIGLIAGLVIGLITVLVMKAKLKSVRKRNEASDYVRKDSFHLTSSSDVYLYRNVRRTERSRK